MTHRRVAVALYLNGLLLSSLAVGCGDYGNEDPAVAGGGQGGSGTSGTGGGKAGGGGSGPAGTGGSGGAGMSGASGSAPAGTGGDAGSGPAGNGGATAGGGSGGTDAGTSGTAGSSGGSGGGGAVSCDAVEPCGGDVVGTWNVSDCPLTLTGGVDLTGLGLPVACELAPITSGTAVLTGMITFNADGTYMDGTILNGEAEWEYSPDCLEISGTETTCDGISSPLGSKGFSEVTCVDNPETLGCTCQGTLFEQEGGLGYQSFDASTSGNYQIMSNTLLIASFSEDVDYSFCAAETALVMTLNTVATSGTLTGPIVLTK
jgi:hypothetical protein